MTPPLADAAAAPSATDAVYVEAPARLHFGMLDLRGALGRKFGGIGAAVPNPSIRIEARPAPTLSADGPAADRVLHFAQLVIEHYGVRQGAQLRVHATIPAHSGLGSGTQLALAVARAIAELYDLPRDADALAVATQRARRSAIGTWIFAEGGFVVEDYTLCGYLKFIATKPTPHPDPTREYPFPISHIPFYLATSSQPLQKATGEEVLDTGAFAIEEIEKMDLADWPTIEAVWQIYQQNLERR